MHKPVYAVLPYPVVHAATELGQYELHLSQTPSEVHTSASDSLYKLTQSVHSLMEEL